MIKSEKCLWYILYWISCLTITWQCMAKECIPLPLNHWSGFIWYFASLMPTHMLWSWFLKFQVKHDFDLIQYIFLVNIQDESHIGLKMIVGRIFPPWHNFLNQSRMIYGSRITWKKLCFLWFLAIDLKLFATFWNYKLLCMAQNFFWGIIVAIRLSFSWSLMHGSSWSSLIKIEPAEVLIRQSGASFNSKTLSY